MKTKFLLSLAAVSVLSCLASCSSDEPKRKKVVGPPSDGSSSLPWNRPRQWEGTARYGPMVPQSR